MQEDIKKKNKRIHEEGLQSMYEDAGESNMVHEQVIKRIYDDVG